MKRSERLRVVEKLAQRAEEAAALRLSSTRSEVESARRQRQQVEDYQREYLARVNGRVRVLSAATMCNDRQFLQQLQSVLDVQDERIEQLHQAEQRCLQDWQVCHGRRLGVERLIQHLRADESASAERLLQREMDELSSLMRRVEGH